MDHKLLNKQRWLLFLFHARTCKPSCPDRNCVTVQSLWRHMNSCVELQCLYPRCCPSKAYISHYHNCQDLWCPLCVPVTDYLQRQATRLALLGFKIESSTVDKAHVSNDSVQASDGAVSGALHCADTLDDLKLRKDMRTLVFNMLKQRQPSPADATSKANYMDVARGLEEELFKIAISKEDYVNRSTLESRITSLLIKDQLNNYNPNLMVTPYAGASVCLRPSSNTVGPMDQDILKVREYMRNLVFRELQKQDPSQDDDASKAKYLAVARSLEEGIYKMATSMEDYMNPSTLESRLANLIIDGKLNNNNQIQQNANSSSPNGTMIPAAPEVSAETITHGEREAF